MAIDPIKKFPSYINSQCFIKYCIVPHAIHYRRAISGHHDAYSKASHRIVFYFS